MQRTIDCCRGYNVVRVFALFLTMISACAGLSQAAASDIEPISVLRFTDYRSGPVTEWLKHKGFVFERDVAQPDAIGLNVNGNGLVLEAKRNAFGIMLNQTMKVAGFSEVEIDWGVEGFPAGASYEKGILNEAIAVQFFLGEERIPSGISSRSFFAATTTGSTIPMSATTSSKRAAMYAPISRIAANWSPAVSTCAPHTGIISASGTNST
jgi:hypothetical protein